jgi:branched-chain amino acid transport system permease protein
MATATGIHHRTYRAELRLRHTKAEWFRLGLVIVLLLVVPYVLNTYWLGIANSILIAVVGAVGPQHPRRLHRPDLPRPGRLPRRRRVHLGPAVHPRRAAGSPVLGLLGRPHRRFLTEGKGYIEVPRLPFIERETFEIQWYWILLPITFLAVLMARNVFRTSLGRSFMAVRDQDIAAEAIGVNITRAKVTAFALSSGFVGLSGALSAYYTETVTWERFTLDVSVLYLAMIIVGGLGSIAGSVYGAIFMMLLPALLTEVGQAAGNSIPFLNDQLPAIKNAIFGIAIITFLLIEPRGLDRIWSRMKDYVRFWPFRY